MTSIYISFIFLFALILIIVLRENYYFKINEKIYMTHPVKPNSNKKPNIGSTIQTGNNRIVSGDLVEEGQVEYSTNIEDFDNGSEHIPVYINRKDLVVVNKRIIIKTALHSQNISRTKKWKERSMKDKLNTLFDASVLLMATLIIFYIAWQILSEGNYALNEFVIGEIWICVLIAFILLLIGIHAIGYCYHGMLYKWTSGKWPKIIDYFYYIAASIFLFLLLDSSKQTIIYDILVGSILFNLKILKTTIEVFTNSYNKDVALIRSIYRRRDIL